MLPIFFLVMMQAAPPDQPPGPPPGFSNAPPAQPPPVPVAPPPYPYPYTYPQQPYPQPYQQPYPPPQFQPQVHRPRQPPTSWFVRAQIGLGPPGFSDQTSLLRQEGYSGIKFWVDLDGGYFVHPNAAIGVWAALDFWSDSPGKVAPTLHENGYFVGGEVPLKFGDRDIAFIAAPRIGFATGKQSFGGTTPFISALAWGAQMSVLSFRYHLNGSVQILRAATDAPGQTGRAHDLGGFVFMIGGTIDG